MKKSLMFFVCATVGLAGLSAGAVTIKKAAPVATKEVASSGESAATFVPAVLSVVSQVQQIAQKQRALSDECIPSSSDITFVNNMMKEWAKTGNMTAEEAKKRLKYKRCRFPDGGYSMSVATSSNTESDLLCFDYFGTNSDRGMVWENFPKASVATYCSDGSATCSRKEQKTASNIYEVFNLIDFDTEDYTLSEATNAARLMGKIENCSSAKLNARKRALWGEFLVNTLGAVGQKTNTGAIMQSVGSLTSGPQNVSTISSFVGQLFGAQ